MDKTTETQSLEKVFRLRKDKEMKIDGPFAGRG